jgi:hypothetical protein
MGAEHLRFQIKRGNRDITTTNSAIQLFCRSQGVDLVSEGLIFDAVIPFTHYSSLTMINLSFIPHQFAYPRDPETKVSFVCIIASAPCDDPVV